MSQSPLSRIAAYRRQRLALGSLRWLFFKGQRLRSRFAAPGTHFQVRTPFATHPLIFRAKTSDTNVFSQVFIDREYRCLDHVQEPVFIIDCGANVGYSSAYFLSRFPMAHVLAIEPDPANYIALCANMKRYGSRCTTLQLGVWSTSVGLVVEAAPLGSGHEWATRVRNAMPGETNSIESVDIGTLLHGSVFDVISILKVDIEGSEIEVFGANTDPWIGKVENLVIELHGDNCRSVFMNAIDGLGFDVSECDELTVCKRVEPRSH